MKIELVTETFAPEINGVAMTLHRLVCGLAKRGHQMTVIRPRQGDKDQAQETPYRDVLVPGCPIPRYPDMRFGFYVYWKLKKRWSSERPDLVHVATEGPLGLAAVHAARNLNIPLISSFHTNFHSYGKHYGYGILIRAVIGYLRWVHNKTRATFGPSKDLMSTLEDEGFKNVKMLGRGVDTELFGPHRRSKELRKSWGIEGDTPVSIYVGRIAGEKNIPLSIRAFEAMKERIPQMKFVFVGEGPLKEKLEKEYPDFIFAGPKRGEELATYFASGDLFLFGSITETFGNVVTEAMASGLLVTAYDYAAPQRYIKHAENGFKATYEDEDAFMKVIQELLDKRSEWEAVRKAARETAMGISWDTVIDGFAEEIYKLAGKDKAKDQLVTSG